MTAIFSSLAAIGLAIVYFIPYSEAAAGIFTASLMLLFFAFKRASGIR